MLRSLMMATAIVCALLAAVSTCGQDTSAMGVAFNQCSACHSVDGTNGTGPTLKGIIGRKSGTVPGFRYSRAMKNAAITWDEASVDRYLSNPQDVVPGNIMPFSGVADAARRANLIAYLKTLR